MPAKSKAQQRFFGMVRAAQKGELKNPSPEIKRAAKEMSKKDVLDFAETKHKKLPEHKKQKKSVKVSESQLCKIIEECVHNVLTEAKISNKDLREATKKFLKTYDMNSFLTAHPQLFDVITDWLFENGGDDFIKMIEQDIKEGYL